MTEAVPTLADLRREIDELDTAIADLLIRRHDVVAQIAAVKTGSAVPVRPGREAAVLRRLVARTQGKLAADGVVRVWREIFAAATRAQGTFAVAVCAPTGERDLWDLARAHFGAATTALRVDRPAQALRTLGDDLAQIAVLPAPSDEHLWWVGLIEAQPRLHVIARLPFATDATEGGAAAEAFAVARVEPDPSADDLSLLVIDAAEGASRGRLRDLLAAVDLDASWRAVTRVPGAANEALHLVEVVGFVEPDDERLERVRQANAREIFRLIRLGAYARPLRLEHAD